MHINIYALQRVHLSADTEKSFFQIYHHDSICICMKNARYLLNEDIENIVQQ